MHNRSKRQSIHTSCLNGEVIRSTAEKIASAYEAKAYNAQRANQAVESQLFFNHAEHWKKVSNSVDLIE